MGVSRKRGASRHRHQCQGTIPQTAKAFAVKGFRQAPQVLETLPRLQAARFWAAQSGLLRQSTVTGRVRHHEKAQRRAGWRPTQGQDVRPGLVPHTLKPFWVNPAMQAPQVLSSTPVSQDSRFKLVQTSSDVPSQLAVHAPHPPRDGTAEHTYPPHLPQPKSMLQSSANEK